MIRHVQQSCEKAEGSQSVKEGGTKPQLQRGGCLGLWWFPGSGFICETRLHFISEFFLISEVQTGNPSVKLGLQVNCMGSHIT